MSEMKIHPTLPQRAYPNVPNSRIYSYNLKVEEHSKLLKSAKNLGERVQEESNRQANRILWTTLALGVVIFVIIWVVTDSFMAGFWSVIISPILLGIGSSIIDPSRENGDEISLQKLNAQIQKLDNELRIEATEFNNIEHSIQIATFKRRSDYWLAMSGWEFEKQIAKLFESYKYTVVVTKGSADGGVDLFLKKDGTRYAVQCKNHSKPVGPASVRDLYGAMRHERVSKGIFVSSNGYTVGAKEFARNKPIDLLDIGDIIQMHNSVN